VKHLTQNAIDQIVLNIENNSDTIFDSEDHINNCDNCSKRIEEALSFNVNLSTFLKLDSSPKLKKFIKELHTDNKEVFVAYPIIPIINIPNKSFAVNYAASAASPAIHKKYQYISSFITGEVDVLVRVMKNNFNKNTYLYIISDDEKKYQNKIVTLSNIKKKYQSDSHGKVNLGKIDLPDIEDLAVTIRSK